MLPEAFARCGRKLNLVFRFRGTAKNEYESSPDCPIFCVCLTRLSVQTTALFRPCPSNGFRSAKPTRERFFCVGACSSAELPTLVPVNASHSMPCCSGAASGCSTAGSRAGPATTAFRSPKPACRAPHHPLAVSQQRPLSLFSALRRSTSLAPARCLPCALALIRAALSSVSEPALTDALRSRCLLRSLGQGRDQQQCGHWLVAAVQLLCAVHDRSHPVLVSAPNPAWFNSRLGSLLLLLLCCCLLHTATLVGVPLRSFLLRCTCSVSLACFQGLAHANHCGRRWRRFRPG